MTEITAKQAEKLLTTTFLYTIILIIIGSLTGIGWTLLIGTLVFIAAVIIQPKILRKKKK